MIAILMDFRVGVVKMKKIIIFVILFGVCLFAQIQNECIECHAGIKDIRDKNSGMMKAILQKAD